MYELGIDHGVLYPPGQPGVAWNGLISVEESADSSDTQTAYFDGQKFLRRLRPGEYSASVSVFYWPDEFLQMDGRVSYFDGQRRYPFGMSWRTQISETDFRVHILYNAMANPSSKQHQTSTNDPGISNFSWDLMAMTHIVVDTSIAHDGALSALWDALYGADGSDPYLPTIDELTEIFESHALLRIIDNGDGTWTAIDDGDYISMIDAQTFQIDTPSAVYIDEDTYKIQSL